MWFCGQTSVQAESTSDARYHQGLRLLKHRRFTQATAYFRRALQIAPEEAKIWFALGVSLYKAQDLPGAYEAYRNGLQLLPPPALQARLRSGLGDIFFEQQDFTAAIEAYTRALDYQPGWTGVRLKLATALLREQRFKEALSHTEALESVQLPPAEALYLNGLIYLAQGQNKKAIAALEQLTAYPAHEFNARQMLTWLYMQAQMPEYFNNRDAMSELSGAYPEVYRVVGFGESQRDFDCFLRTASPCVQEDLLDTLQRWRLSGVGLDSAHEATGLYYQLRQNWSAAADAYQRAYAAFPERRDYRLRAEALRWTQAQRDGMSPDQFQAESYALRELKVLSQWTETEIAIKGGKNTFWNVFFQQPWYQKPTLEMTKRWRQLNIQQLTTSEEDIIKAWQLWLAGESDWALKVLEQARTRDPHWWLPHALWGWFALQIPKHETAAYQAVEIAYTLNPLSLKLMELRLQNPGLSEANYARYLRQAQLSFPAHKPFQDRLLRLLNGSGPQK